MAIRAVDLGWGLPRWELGPLGLPIGPHATIEQIDRVAEVIRAAA